jgi:hypothetical protein
MTTVTGESADANMAGVVGKSTVNGVGIWGEANPNGRAIVGVSNEGAGVWGHTASGRGVVGVSDAGVGVWGANRAGRAVVGAVDEDGTGVWGEVKTGTGVVGVVHEGGGAGVSGRNDAGDGVLGVGRRGVVGMSDTYQGVYGKSRDNAGVVGESDQMHAVFCLTHSASSAGVYATNSAGGNAALFEGNVTVTGDLVLAGADVAEHFDVAPDEDELAAGTVAVLDDDGRIGAARQSYDHRVVGIVSGAGDRVPALVLDRHNHGGDRRPIAVAGKAWCLADATTTPIKVGDLLTTAGLAGHAMRAEDRVQAIGATIGKAITGLAGGTGHVLVLVGLG